MFTLIIALLTYALRHNTDFVQPLLALMFLGLLLDVIIILTILGG